MGTTDDKSTTGLLRMGPIAVMLFTAAVIVFGAARSDYSHLSDTVSELGRRGSPLSPYYNLCVVLAGLLVMGFARGVYRVVGEDKSAKWGVMGLMVIGLVNVTGAVFPLDPVEDPSWSNAVHTVSGLLMLLAYLVAIPLLNRAIRENETGIPAWSLSIVWLLGLLGMAAMLMLSNAGLQGLGQRVFYLGLFGWIGLVSLTLEKKWHGG